MATTATKAKPSVNVQPDQPFGWNEKRERAAVMLAADEVSDARIAEACGINEVTLNVWKKHPEFAERVRDETAAIRTGALRYAIAKKHRRIGKLNEIAERMEGAIDARAAEAAADPDAPAEARTGLFSRKTVMSASGKERRDYVFDAQLVREYRATLEQAARELGQLVDRSEVTNETIVRRYVGVDVEAV